MRFRRFSAYAAALAVAFVTLASSPAYAFKTKTHLVLANQVLDDAKDGKLTIAGLGRDLDPKNADVIEALKLYPEAFRAGVLGPDNYPDLIGGQVWVHGGGHSTKKYEQRNVGEFRSIDYGMFLLKQADSVSNRNERLQALAFAYGYLAHMVGDGFAHSFVNEWAGGAWKLQEGEGMFGPLTEEIKHLAVEGLLDETIGHVREGDLRIAAPIKFLQDVFRKPMTIASNRTAPAGSFAGEHIKALIDVRNKLQKAADGDWSGPFDGKFSEALIEASEAAAKVGVFNPIDDVTWFLEQRVALIDEIILALPKLSDCIAQNIVAGQNRVGTRPIEADACEQIDFEPAGSKAEFIFGGALNTTAWDGRGDPGSFAKNAERLADFYFLVLEEGLKFKVERDLRILGQINEKVDVCQAVFDWGGCDAACDAASRLCVKAIERATCWGCPTRNGEYNCTKTWKLAARCTALGHCWACDKLPLWQELTNDACDHGTNVAAPVCELCRDENSLCAASESIRTLQEFAGGAWEEALDEALGDIKDLAVDVITAVVFGRYYDDVKSALEIYDMRKDRGASLWLVNAAFFREDLRAGGREYLMELFHKALGVPKEVMATAKTAPAFAEATSRWLLPTPVGKKILWGESNTWRDNFQVYQNFIKFLWGLMDGSSEAVLVEEYNHWVTTVKVNQKVRRDLKVNFISLLDELGMLHTIAGPTATALIEGMTQQTYDPAEIMNVRVDPRDFAPTFNTIQLTKLSLASGPAMRGWFGSNFMLGDHVSQICKDHPHVLCDGIAVLDDPNNHGSESTPVAIDPPSNQRFPLATAYDPQRSVSLWAPRTISWTPEGIRSRDACVAAHTSFSLARSPALTPTKYERMFRMPDGCITTTMNAALAGLR